MGIDSEQKPQVTEQVDATAEAAQLYKYTEMMEQAESTVDPAPIDEVTDFLNYSAFEGEGDDQVEVGVKDKFAKLADGFRAIPQLILNLRDAFTTKFEGMVTKVNNVFKSMNKNVSDTVKDVQDDAHSKREDIRGHVNAEGKNVEDAINALQNAEQNLKRVRTAAEQDRQDAIEEAKEAQKANDEKVQHALDEHDARIDGHQNELEGHGERLDDHEGRLKTHTHQLGLVKNALDKDCGPKYGSKHIKGTHGDKVRDWDCELNAEGQPANLGEDGKPTDRREKATAEELNTSDSGRRRLASDADGSSSVTMQE